MPLKSDVCCDRREQWGHGSALAALQRLRGGLSLTDAFRAAEEALSGQPDASEALLHTFHPSTHSATLAWVEVVRAGSQFLLKMTFNMSPADLTGRRNGFFGVTECSASRASPWLIFTAPLNVSGAHLWSHTTCLHPGFVASPHSLQMTACN